MTEIVLVVDRSGSMRGIHKDMEGGMNQLVADQKNGEGDAYLTYARFDTEYELVHDHMNLKTFDEKLRLEPRGGTALLDAVGKTVTTVREHKREGKHIVIIVTDGQENSSREWKLGAVKSLIEECKSDDWEFVFLGANVDVFAEAGGMGIAAASSAAYDPNAQSVQAAFVVTSEAIAGTRSGTRSMAYTQKERDKIRKASQ